jgi:hypothetical protein
MSKLIARSLIALVAGLTLASADANAQQFQIEDVPSMEALQLKQLKPKTIAFNDRGNDEVADAGGIFMRYEDWAKARPLQQQMLSLYPGYTEPNSDVIVDGTKKRYREKLHMYVAQARFVVTRPASSLDLSRYATLPFVERLDPAIKHKLATPAELARPKEMKSVYNQNPQRRWCEGRASTICLHSTYKLEGRLPVGIALANKIRDNPKKISDTLEFDGELTVLSPAEVAERGLSKLTGIDQPAVGALEQSIFYVNQVIEFGKMLAVFQQYPGDPNKTVVSVFMSLGLESNILTKRKDYANVPVLRNLLPAQVLAGKSSFNSGSSLSAGLPVYARNQVKAIAAILERG